jgi:hypothetical protein
VIGKPNTYVLFDKSDPANPKRYIQNAGLDYNKDGRITKAEATARVSRQCELGAPDGRHFSPVRIGS